MTTTQNTTGAATDCAKKKKSPYAEIESPANIPTPAGLLKLIGGMDDTAGGKEIKTSCMYMAMELATATLPDKTKIRVLGGMGPNLAITYEGRSVQVSAEKLIEMAIDFGLTKPAPIDFPAIKA